MHMQQLSHFPRWLPLVLLGSLPASAGAAEQFFPVRLDSGTHWFSALDGSAPFERQQSALPAAPSSLQLLHSLHRHEEALEQRMTTADAWDSSQLETLAQLSRLLQDSGSHAEAFERLEQHYFLARISRGLHHKSHIPVVQTLAELAQLMGDTQRAHDLREALLNLGLRVYDEDEPGRIETWLEWAEWHLHCYLEHAATPWLLGPAEQDPWLNPHFLESDTHYRRALHKLVAHDAPPATSAQSLLLAMRNWQALHIVAARRQSGLAHAALPGQPQFAVNGLYSPSLSHISYVTETMRQATEKNLLLQGTELELYVAQLVLLGDWLHAVDLSQQARSTYQEAWDMVKDASLPTAQAEQLLGSGLPVPDPEQWYRIRRNPGSLQRHIDAEITLDADGNVEDLVLLDSGSADTVTVRALKRHIAGSRFRPPFGDSANARVVRLRYYHD